jgi:hypothetical protein
MAGRRDGSKPSFAELDRRRRERRSGGGNRDGRSPVPQKAYRAALERAFAEGKVDELAAYLAPIRDPSPSTPSPPTPSPTAPSPPATTTVPGDPARAEKKDLLAAIRAADTADDANKAIDRWRTRFSDLPADPEILEKALAHPDATVVLSALSALDKLLATTRPRRTRSLCMQLSILESTSSDDDVSALAKRLRLALQ